MTLELLIQPIDVGCDIKQVSTWARFEPFGTVLVLRTTTTSQKCEAVPRRARISGSWTFVSLNSRLESNKEETWARGRDVAVVLLDYLPTPARKFQTFEIPYSRNISFSFFRVVDKTLLRLRVAPRARVLVCVPLLGALRPRQYQDIASG